MKLLKSFSISAVCLSFLISNVTTADIVKEKILDWKDPVTGYSYIFLQNARTYPNAQAACGNRGWDLFNLGSLSPDEQERFYQSPLYAALPWTVRFEGDPGENKETAYWTSTIIDNSALGIHLRVLKIEGKVRSEELRYSMDPEAGAKLYTFCMYRGPEWFKCSAVKKCTYSVLASKKYWVEFRSLYSNIYQEGSNHRDLTAMMFKEYNEPVQIIDGIQQECRILPEKLECKSKR